MRTAFRVWTAQWRPLLSGFRERVRRITPNEWLTAAVLFYFVILPFNAYGVRIERIGNLFKYTELALFAIMGTAAVVYRQLPFPIRKAQWLYGFLLLHAVAQFVSLANAREPLSGLDVAVSVAQYSVLVLLFVNVIRTDAVLRKILLTMGIVAGAMALAAYGYRLLQGRAFHPSITGEWLLGIGGGHYLAYAFILYSVGLVYLFLSGIGSDTRARWMRWLIVIATLISFQMILLAAVKVAHIVTPFFLLLLVVTLRGVRGRATALLFAFLGLFLLQFFTVPLKNRYLVLTFPIRERVLAWSDRAASQNIVVSVSDTSEKPGTSVAVAPPVSPQSSSPTPVPSVPPSPAPQPSAQVSPPPAPRQPDLIDEYSPENRVRRRWFGKQLSDSKKIRQRGIAVGLLMGSESPITGVGAGQTPYTFDAYNAKVQEKAHEQLSWFGRLFFTDETLKLNQGDKGLFNIFMNAFAETGFPGLIAIVGILAVITVKSIRALWAIRHESGVYPIRLLFPLFLALLLYHQTIYLWVHPWFWTVIALTYVAADVAVVSAVKRGRHRIPHHI